MILREFFRDTFIFCCALRSARVENAPESGRLITKFSAREEDFSIATQSARACSDAKQLTHICTYRICTSLTIEVICRESCQRSSKMDTSDEKASEDDRAVVESRSREFLHTVRSFAGRRMNDLHYRRAVAFAWHCSRRQTAHVARAG